MTGKPKPNQSPSWPWLDLLAARLGIWAIKRLWGTCPPEDYDPDCISCAAGNVVRGMQDILDGRL